MTKVRQKERKDKKGMGDKVIVTGNLFSLKGYEQ